MPRCRLTAGGTDYPLTACTVPLHRKGEPKAVRLQRAFVGPRGAVALCQCPLPAAFSECSIKQGSKVTGAVCWYMYGCCTACPVSRVQPYFYHSSLTQIQQTQHPRAVSTQPGLFVCSSNNPPVEAPAPLTLNSLCPASPERMGSFPAFCRGGTGFPFQEWQRAARPVLQQAG